MTTDPFEERHGLTYDQLWRRATCEMALIKQHGRQADLPAPTWDAIHNLAEQILDELIIKTAPSYSDEAL